MPSHIDSKDSQPYNNSTPKTLDKQNLGKADFRL